MKKIFPGVKIDWPNHLIGFFSALFGILIAFELDDWRERQNQLELAANAMERMTTEISFNQNILHTNTARNIKSIETLRQLSTNLNDQLLFAGSPEEIDSINSQFPDYIFIHAESVNPSNRFPAHVGVGSIRMISQHTSAWESAKATGVLNFLDYEKVLALSTIYNFTSIADEVEAIRQLTRKADEIRSKEQLLYFLSEIEESLRIIERELIEYDQFVNMIELSN